MTDVPPLARLKHLLATSPAGRPLARLRALGHSGSLSMVETSPWKATRLRRRCHQAGDV